MPETAQIYIVDDDPVARRAMRDLLVSAGYPVRAFQSVADFIDEIPSLSPGCALVEAQMSPVDGLGVLAHTRSVRSDVPVVMMCRGCSTKAVVRAIKAGAIDVIEKNWTDQEKIDQMLSIISEAPIIVRKRTIKKEAIDRISKLSARESEVLRRVSRGELSKNVAFALNLSPRTIEMHRQNIIKHLGVRSIGDAIQIYFLALSDQVIDFLAVA